MDATRQKIISDITSADLTLSSFNIQNPSRDVIEKSLDELIKENHEYAYIDSHPQILIDRILKLKPELSVNESVRNIVSPEENIPKRSIVATVFGWLIGLLLIVTSFGFFSHSILSGVAILIAGLLFLPPVHSFVFSVTSVNIHWIMKIVLAMGFMFYASSVVSNKNNEEFQNNREAIVSDIKKKLLNKDYLGATALTGKYKSFDDEELLDLGEQANDALERERLEREAKAEAQRKIEEEEREQRKREEERLSLKNKENELLGQLEKTDKRDFGELLVLYEKLSKGSPDNEEYKKGFIKYKNERIKSVVSEVKKVKSSDFEKNIELYNILLLLDGSNEKYEEKIRFYVGKRKEKEQEIARKKVEEYEKEASRIGSLSMTKETICDFAGFLVTKKLEKLFKGYSYTNSDCHVEVVEGNIVEIKSVYLTPFKINTSLRYTARGRVRGNSLSLDEIKVHGQDEDFISFDNFPFE